ncbi:MAG: TfoX/Sxy family protein [Phaeodactylibacter sp.]|nr:TfoX/Sxy family protein [Phaeodactylibacter sp.]MCB9053117.1 TfoX/Sxy family protein [Lewinellaceae bacterium]
MEKNTTFANRENYLNYILGQLSELDNFTFRKMIGGIGFFRDELMFGAIIGGKLRFRASAACAEQCGTTSYLFDEWARQSCEVPENVIEDKAVLKSWAERSIALLERGKERA